MAPAACTSQSAKRYLLIAFSSLAALTYEAHDVRARTAILPWTLARWLAVSEKKLDGVDAGWLSVKRRPLGRGPGPKTRPAVKAFPTVQVFFLHHPDTHAVQSVFKMQHFEIEK